MIIFNIGPTGNQVCVGLGVKVWSFEGRAKGDSKASALHPKPKGVSG